MGFSKSKTKFWCSTCVAMILYFVISDLAFSNDYGSYIYTKTGYRWERSDIPVRYRKRSGDALAVPTSWHDAIDKAAQAWWGDTVFTFTPDSYGYTIDIISSSSPEIAEVATLNWSGSYYREQVMRIRPNPLHPWGYPTDWYTHPTNEEAPPTDDYNLYTVVAHEFGHCVGLDDVDDPYPLMYELYNSDADSLHVRKTTTEHELYGAVDIYEEDAGGTGGGWSGCKPALVTTYTPGAKLANLMYIYNFRRSKTIVENSFFSLIENNSYRINEVLLNDSTLRTMVENFSEHIAKDIHLSIASGNGDDIYISSSQINELNRLLDALEFKIGSQPEFEAMRRLLIEGENITFWSMFNTDLVANSLDSKPQLYQNVPNPFNPSTTINFYVPFDGYARILIYSQNGQVIRSLLSKYIDMGRHQIVWDGKDDYGRIVSSGIYVYRLEIPDISFVKQRKLTLVR